MSTESQQYTPPPLSLDRCFTINKLAEHIQISRRTITRALSAGELEHYRVGARVVIPETAAVAWLESKRITKNHAAHHRWVRKQFPK